MIGTKLSTDEVGQWGLPSRVQRQTYPTDGKAGQGGNVRPEISPEAARDGGKIEGGNWANEGRGRPMWRRCGHTMATESTGEDGDV